MRLIVRPGILDIAPYVPGEHELPGTGPIYKMSSNESALGPSPKAMEAYRRGVAELHRYPDGTSRALREALADGIGAHPDEIICGAGSDELLVLLTRAFAGAGDEVLYSRHGFLVYPIAAQSVGAKPVWAPERNLTADVDALAAAVTERTRICFLANPNNPTGSYISGTELARLRGLLPERVLLVIDSAYAEYVDKSDYSDGAELVRQHENVVMTRTFSKIYGLAGLRLGWTYGQRPVIDVLNRIRGPFNVPGPAQQAGLAALLDREHMESAKAYNDYWLPWFESEIRGLGLVAHPSVGNFSLVRFQTEPKLNADAAERFLKSRRILPRKMGAYGLGDCLRITIAEEPALKACIGALGAFVAGAATQ
jgi:histidinol-phosphate aminotransferase